jgi:hypothetical protein
MPWHAPGWAQVSGSGCAPEGSISYHRPAQEVAFNGAALKFAIGSPTNDNWQVGFCRPGELDAWRTQ